MYNVIFVTPNLTGSLDDESLGTLLLTTILHQNGILTKIVRFSDIGEAEELEDFLNKFVEQVRVIQPQIISFYCRCDTYHISIALAERIKKEFANIYIVFGGPQADITGLDTISDLHFVDFVCCGEGELIIVPFFSSLINQHPDLSTAGLIYKLNGEVYVNPRPDFVENLDDLVFMDYSLSPAHNEMQTRQKVWFPIDVGRGCPFGCSYCSTKSFWGRRYRLKSPNRIIREIIDVHEKFGITSFAFLHDMFTMNRAQITEVCKQLNLLEFPVIWRCSARIDCIDNELIDTMYDAGLRMIYIGIESGSERIQRLINKNLKLDKIIDMMSYIHSKGIVIRTSFIYGFPEETEEDVSKTIALIAKILEIKNVVVQTHLCTFLPGTELSRKYIAEMSESDVYSDITGTVGINKCRQIIKTYPRLFQHFLEYRTELRTKLRYFSLFIAYWSEMETVFRYISQQYRSDGLIQMYYDFVHANEKVLESIYYLSLAKQVDVLREKDMFVQRFSACEYFNIIIDIIKLTNISHAIRIGAINSSQDFYSISPEQLDQRLPVQEYTYKPCIVQFRRESDGRITRKILSKYNKI